MMVCNGPKAVALGVFFILVYNTFQNVVFLEDSLSHFLNTLERNQSYTTQTSTAPARNTTYLVIHVGPVKTGSSSIQCNLQVNEFLALSNYEYLGKADQHNSDRHRYRHHEGTERDEHA